MLKLTKTGIGLLTKQYRSVLRKCFFLNLVFFSTVASLTGLLLTNSYSENINVTSSSTWYSTPNGLSLIEAYSGTRLALLYSEAMGSYSYTDENGVHVGVPTLDFYYKGTVKTRLSSEYFMLNGSSLMTGITHNAVVSANANSIVAKLVSESTLARSLNYYYTFQVDERDEAIEFAKELRSNKKEMSSLDFMPIKSSSDLRINLIKAEDPLTFSAKTRDDSLGLMEVCYA